MLLLVSSIKLVAEIALMAIAGRFLLGLLAGAGRDSNLFYGILDVLARPFLKVTRLLTPPVVLDRHLPLAAFLLLVLIWLLATGYKISLCLDLGMHACR
jgi:hypothetical protein